jgi:hypothetical protein
LKSARAGALAVLLAGGLTGSAPAQEVEQQPRAVFKAEARVVRVDVDVPVSLAGLAPGDYTAELYVLDLVAAGVSARATARLRVVPQ